MRPRVFPAENVCDMLHMEPTTHLASMRPRVFPAENATMREDAVTIGMLQ